MVASIICPFVPSYGLSRARDPEVLETKYGEGYVQRVGIGINNSKAMFTLPFPFRSDQEARDMEGFFDSLGKVVPFLIDIPGESWSVTGAGIGVGDSTRTQFQLQRTRRGSVAANDWGGAWPTYSTPKTNLCTYSQDFTQNIGTNTATVTANQAVAPDGTVSGSKLQDANGSNPFVGKAGSPTVPGTHTVSLWLLAGTSNTSTLVAFDNAVAVQFTAIAGGVISGPGSAVLSGNRLEITNLSTTQWTRVYLTVTGVPTGSFQIKPLVYAHTAGGTAGVLYNFLWGMQIEAGASATAYIPTPSSSPVTTTPAYWPLTTQGFEPVRWTSGPVQVYRQDWQGNQLLYQIARTNLHIRSQELDNAAWTVTRSTITANATAAPDGTTTADKVVEDATPTNTHLALSTSDVVVVSGVTYTMSIYAKAAERTWFALQEGQGVTATAYFNLATGVLGTVSGTGSPSATITQLANGWCRCTLTFTASGTAARMRIFLATGDGGASYSGTGTSGAYFWGAQMEVGSIATSYIATTSAAVTFTDYTLSASGLVTTASAPVTGAVMSFTASGPNRHQLVAKKWTRGWDTSGRNTITVEVEEDFS